MSHRFFPHTPAEIEQMLATVGVASLDDLYADVPDELLLKRDYDIPSVMSEIEIRRFFTDLGRANNQLACFAGGGFYHRYAPAVISAILQRSEFLTAYTPYQPEISQGTLQYIFEYQSMMTELTGMDVSNASLYDGSTATAEAMMMTVSAARKRRRVLVSATVNTTVRNVLDTYAHYHDIVVDTIAETDGVTSREDMVAKLSAGDVAGVILQSPNRYGVIEDLTGFADDCHGAKALMVINTDPSTLALLRTPAEWGADIAVGDAQPLGMPLSFGGPYLGFLCCTKALMRKMPGRIVGATRDEDGQRTFVLTLQAREQHIRRDKATSNICSNQSLMALYVAVYVALMGAKGLREVCSLSASVAHALCSKLQSTGKMRLKYDRPFLNEFTMTTNFPVDELMERCRRNGILAGIKIDDHTVLIAATEMNTREEIDKYVEIVNEI